MIQSLAWGAVLRFLQALLQATPTILVGLLVAGVFRRLLEHAGTRRLFGQPSARSLLQAWLVGMLLPVCSLGVLPVIREMRKAGVAGGAILAFGLTAPLFNPISVLYGLTLSEPVVILAFTGCSLLIVTVMGIVWDRLFPDTAVREAAPPRAAYGIRRMLAVAVAAAQSLLGPGSAFILIGLAGVGLLSVFLPPGSMQQAAEPDDRWAPLFMALVITPAYATPMTAMVQLASMFQHGNSVGAAFALLALGAGTNLGLIAWMLYTYGARRTAVWFGLLWSLVVILAYGVNRPLHPPGVASAGHTHAFDDLCTPFSPGEPAPFSATVRALRDSTAVHELRGLYLLGILAVVGLCLRRSGRLAQLESWLERPRATAAGGYDLVLPGPVLGGVTLVLVVGLSIFGCYVFYPPPDEIFEELRLANTEVVAAAYTGEWDSAAFWVPIQQDWVRKLRVSTFLRGHELSRYQRAKAEVLLDHLEQLEHDVDVPQTEATRARAKDQARRVGQSYRRFREAHLALTRQAE